MNYAEKEDIERNNGENVEGNHSGDEDKIYGS